MGHLSSGMNDEYFWRCAICLKLFHRMNDMRHNADPFMKGRICCTKCNYNIVIPYRIYLIEGGEE